MPLSSFLSNLSPSNWSWKGKGYTATTLANTKPWIVVAHVSSEPVDDDDSAVKTTIEFSLWKSREQGDPSDPSSQIQGYFRDTSKSLLMMYGDPKEQQEMSMTRISNKLSDSEHCQNVSRRLARFWTDQRSDSNLESIIDVRILTDEMFEQLGERGYIEQTV